MCELTKINPTSDYDLSDSVKLMEDVGNTDLEVLQPILSHCTLDQLMHVENCSKGRDLSPITDKLWKNFYKKKFGKANTESAIERMKHKNVWFKWKQLYEAKMEMEERGNLEGWKEQQWLQ